MAERKINGKDIILMVDPAGGTAYSTIVCLTSNSKKLTTAILDAATKCGPDSQAGTQTVTIDFTGSVAVDPDAERISEGDLYPLWKDSTTIGWKIGPAVPVEGDVSYTGTGFISDLSDTYDMNGATFTGTIAASGTPTQEVTPAS